MRLQLGLRKTAVLQWSLPWETRARKSVPTGQALRPMRPRICDGLCSACIGPSVDCKVQPAKPEAAAKANDASDGAIGLSYASYEHAEDNKNRGQRHVRIEFDRKFLRLGLGFLAPLRLRCQSRIQSCLRPSCLVILLLRWQLAVSLTFLSGSMAPCESIARAQKLGGPECSHTSPMHFAT
jgi:hypothetical protein